MKIVTQILRNYFVIITYIVYMISWGIIITTIIL